MIANDLDGIRAELRGYVDSAPRTRFTPTGEAVWEFAVRLADTFSIHTELVVVRVPDERYDLLARWVVPGRQILVRGVAHVVRWTTRDGRELARLLVEPTLELTPLDQRTQGSAPAALDYASRKTRPGAVSATAATTPHERAARVRALLDQEAS